MSASAPAKKKVNRKDYMFNQLNGETVRKTPGQIDGLGFAIRYLENCHASLFDWSSQVSTFLLISRVALRSWSTKSRIVRWWLDPALAPCFSAIAKTAQFTSLVSSSGVEI